MLQRYSVDLPQATKLKTSRRIVSSREIRLWPLSRLNAVRQFFAKQWSEKFSSLYEDGRLHPIEFTER